MPMSSEYTVLCSMMSYYVGVLPWENVAEMIKNGVAWDRLLAAAKIERLGGFLYAILRKNNFLHILPAPLVQDLERIYLTYKARNLLLLDELSKLARIFEDEKIPSVIIKGGDCLRLCYPDKGMRGMDDIDIVVRPEAFEDVRALLIGKGYRGAPYDRDFIYAPSGAFFDLHHDAFDQHRIKSRRFYCSWDFEQVWKMSVPMSAECPTMRYLTPLDEIFVSSLHTAKHAFGGLTHFLDVALLIKKYEGEGNASAMVSERFFARADFFGGKRSLYVMFAFLDEVIGVTMPAVDYKKLLDRPLSGYERYALQAVKERRQPDILGTMLPLCEIRGWRHTLAYIFENCFPRPAVMGEIYQTNNIARIWLLYPCRLVQTIGRMFRP